MLKKDVVATGKVALVTKATNDIYRCGMCLHHKVVTHAQKDTICSKQGIKAFAVAPSCFTPDVSAVASTSDELLALASLFNNFDHKQRRLLIALLKNKKAKKNGLEFATEVYFKAVGSDYVSNYLRGFYVGRTSSGELMVTGDPDNSKRGKSYFALFKNDDDLLSKEEWKTKRAALIAKSRIEDPKKPLRKFKRSQMAIDYEPPTMDTAPIHWHNGTNAPKKGKSKRVEDVSNIITV